MSQTETKNKYRATFILDTRGSEAPVESHIEKLSDTLKGLDGEVTKVENLGRKEFVRVTERGHNEDYFIQIDFLAPGEAVAKLSETLHLDTTVKRIFVETAA
jgi:small subunit ribosomal protein S6